MLDHATGLVWLKNADCSGSDVRWSDALARVQELNANATMAGFVRADTSNRGSHATDWRLPNGREFQTLLDFQQVRPSLPLNHPFDNLTAYRTHCSSTTNAAIPNHAYVANFSDAATQDGIKYLNYGSGEYFGIAAVLAVRGGAVGCR